MRNKNLKTYFLASIILLAIAAAITAPNIIPVSASNSSTFNVSLTISNVPPTITYVASVSDSPAAGTTKVVVFTFNASDGNGYQDIPASNAQITINQSTTSHTSSSCIVLSHSSIENAYSCNITINYYDPAGVWTINASIYDGAAATATNLTQTFTLGTTYGISLNRTQLTFSGSPGQNNVAASNAPQTVINIGNGAFSNMNVTAYDIASGSNTIAASNFNANTTNSPGTALSNNTAVTIPGGSIAVNSTQNLYIFLNVPNGVSNGTYNSVSPWVVTMS